MCFPAPKRHRFRAYPKSAARPQTGSVAPPVREANRTRLSALRVFFYVPVSESNDHETTGPVTGNQCDFFSVAGPVTLSRVVARDSLRPLYLHCVRLCNRGAAALYFCSLVFFPAQLLAAPRPGRQESGNHSRCNRARWRAQTSVRNGIGHDRPSCDRPGFLHIVVPASADTTVSGIPAPCQQSAQLLAIM